MQRATNTFTWATFDSLIICLRTHKQVQYNIRDDNVECTEIDETGSEIATIRFPIILRDRAIGRLNHTIMHDFIPIL